MSATEDTPRQPPAICPPISINWIVSCAGQPGVSPVSAENEGKLYVNAGVKAMRSGMFLSNEDHAPILTITGQSGRPLQIASRLVPLHKRSSLEHQRAYGACATSSRKRSIKGWLTGTLTRLDRKTSQEERWRMKPVVSSTTKPYKRGRRALKQTHPCSANAQMELKWARKTLSDLAQLYEPLAPVNLVGGCKAWQPRHRPHTVPIDPP